MAAPASEAELVALERRIDDWAQDALKTQELVLAVERGEPGQHRWYVRLRGEQKEVFSVWFTLGQRTLRYETFFIPAPQHSPRELFEFLLRRNLKLYGLAFAVGPEDAVFLAGRLPVEQVTEVELDRILGTIWEESERSFATALRLGFGVERAGRHAGSS